MKSEDFPLTEQRNPLSEDIDVKSSSDIVDIFYQEDLKLADIVYAQKKEIAAVIENVAAAFKSGGRLIYVGAGTSGRLGFLDASEAQPTFGVDPSLVSSLIAGGEEALISSVEGAEDNASAGKKDISQKKVNARDMVIGISSSSSTLYVHGALKEAKLKGAKTVLITCTPLAEVLSASIDQVITVLTGPEIITGSTRLKAGTATKMVLNMISTGAMILNGRTYGNLMVDLVCSNKKLIKRGVKIVQSVTRLSEKKSAALLQSAQMEVKTAIAMSYTDQSYDQSKKNLLTHKNHLRPILRPPHQKNPNIEAVIFDMDGTILRYGLPNGFSTWAALGWSYGIFEDMQKWVSAYTSDRMSYEDIWKNCAESLAGRSAKKAREVLFPCSGQPPLSRGFTDAVELLRPHYKLGIISSGLSMVARHIQSTLKLDFERSNHLGIKNDLFDGTYEINVPFDFKIKTLEQVGQELKIDLKKTCFIGDSGNDEEVLRAVGFPIAYNPSKASVVEAARGNVIGDFLFLPKMLSLLKLA